MVYRSKFRLRGHFVEVAGTRSWNIGLRCHFTGIQAEVIGKPFHIHAVITFSSLDFVNQAQN